MTQATHADIQMGDDDFADPDDDSSLETGHAPAPSQAVPRKKKGLPGLVKAAAAGFGLVVVGLMGTLGYQIWQRNKLAAEQRAIEMAQPMPAPGQPMMMRPNGAPVPVSGPATVPQPAINPMPVGPVPGAAMQPAMTAPAAVADAPAQAAPNAVAGQPAQAPVNATTTATVNAPTSPSAQTAPTAMATAPAGEAGPMVDPRTAQILRDWPRDRDEMQKRMSAMDARLQELTEGLKALRDNRNAPAQPKTDPKPAAKKEAHSKPVSKDTANTEEAEHKREAAAGVVRGVPRGVTKASAQPAKANTEPQARRDYYLTGWIGNLAYYERVGNSSKDSREDSVRVGDVIDGVKVVSIDTRNRRIVLENNQYIGTR
ncbi:MULTISPECIES: hypothetical protein [Cupriavidus]